MSKTKRADIGTGWTVFMVEDTRGPREDEHGAEIKREMPEECDIVRCECCNRRIYVVVHMRRGEQSIMVGQGCAREAGYSVPPRLRTSKARPAAPVVVQRVEPTQPSDPCPDVDPAAYVLPSGEVDLLALCDAIGIAAPSWA